MRDDAEKPAHTKPDESNSAVEISLRIIKAVMYRDADAFALAFADWLRIKRLRVSKDAQEILTQTLERT